MEKQISLNELFKSFEKESQEFPLLDIFQKFNATDYSGSMKYTMTSPELIRRWSFGEIKRSEIINIQTEEPFHDGLFCSRIFGPTKNYECLCGKYQGLQYRGFICEKCDVEVNRASLRGERMAHIELVVPCANIWFVKVLPTFLGLVLDMTLSDIEHVLYFEAYIVTDPGVTPIKKYSILSEDDFDDLFAEYGNKFKAKMGAEAVKDLLQNLDIEYEIQRSSRVTESENINRKNAKRLLAFEMFKKNSIKPEWMMLDALPVIAPDLRPLGPLIEDRFEPSDFNQQYRQIISINNRLKKIIELQAPSIFLAQQKLRLQEAVDCLLDNKRSRKVMIGVNKTPLRSLASLN
jgi:DNA-directed RNA polymerase subunit beta'